MGLPETLDLGGEEGGEGRAHGREVEEWKSGGMED